MINILKQKKTDSLLVPDGYTEKFNSVQKSSENRMSGIRPIFTKVIEVRDSKYVDAYLSLTFHHPWIFMT